MRHTFGRRFVEELESLPQSIQDKFYKQLRFLLANLRHPSLHAKKYEERRGIWQARLNKHYRLYFSIDGDCYVLLRVKRHED